MGISRLSIHSISQKMAPMLDVSLADKGTCPRHLEEVRKSRELFSRVDFSGLRVDDGQAVANGFHSEDRLGPARCLASARALMAAPSSVTSP